MSNDFAVCEVRSKSILNRSKIPGIDLVINPYIGCQHACIYCYARFMMRFSGHAGDTWGRYVDVKINALDLLEKKLESLRRNQRVKVLFSSVTDAYQPVERRYEITRKCIAILRDHAFPVSILTKSDLVVRDTDLLKANPSNEVGLTIITLDQNVCRVFESGAPAIGKRLQALRRLSEAGLYTYAFVGPIIPILSTESLDELIRNLGEAGVKYIIFDRMNVKSSIGPSLKKQLVERFPNNAKRILHYIYLDTGYYDSLRSFILDTCASNGVDPRIVF